MKKKAIIFIAIAALSVFAVNIILPICLFYIWDLDNAFDGNSAAIELRRDIARIGFIAITFPALYALEYLLIKSSIQPAGMLGRLIWNLRIKN
ncbi:MAG: hypothetical protein ACSHYA_07950 [Opitutaceae bacterium]